MLFENSPVHSAPSRSRADGRSGRRSGCGSSAGARHCRRIGWRVRRFLRLAILLVCDVRDEDGGKTAQDQDEEIARAARWRRRTLMAVEVRRGEKLLLGEVAGEFERLASL